MKKNILSSIIVITGIIAFFLFSGLECNDKKDDPEGECLRFRNLNITWKKAPTLAPYWPLNPEEHITKQGDTYEFNYRPSSLVEKVCTKEATFVTVKSQINELYYDQFALMPPTLVHNDKDYSLPGDWNQSVSSNGGITTMQYSITIEGELDGGETTMQLGLNLIMLDQGGHDATIYLFNNAVVELEIDWAYTEYE